MAPSSGAAAAPAATARPLRDAVAGAVAGAANLTAGFPFDTVKVVQQASPGRYATSWACARGLAAQGPLTLFRGMSAPLAGAALETGINYAVYVATLKRLCPGWEPGGKRGVGENRPPLTAVAAAAAAAGAALSLVLSPFELVKCRLQADGAHYGGSPSAVVRATLAADGPRGLLRGATGTLAREVPGNAIFFTTYAVCRRAIGGGGGGAPPSARRRGPPAPPPGRPAGGGARGGGGGGAAPPRPAVPPPAARRRGRRGRRFRRRHVGGRAADRHGQDTGAAAATGGGAAVARGRVGRGRPGERSPRLVGRPRPHSGARGARQRGAVAGVGGVRAVVTHACRRTKNARSRLLSLDAPPRPSLPRPPRPLSLQYNPRGRELHWWGWRREGGGSGGMGFGGGKWGRDRAQTSGRVERATNQWGGVEWGDGGRNGKRRGRARAHGARARAGSKP